MVLGSDAVAKSLERVNIVAKLSKPVVNRIEIQLKKLKDFITNAFSTSIGTKKDYSVAPSYSIKWCSAYICNSLLKHLTFYYIMKIIAKTPVLILLFLLSLFNSHAQTQSAKDKFCQKPCGSYEERKKEGLTFIRDNGTKEGLYGIFNQVARAGLGEKVEEDYIRKAIFTIRRNRDCNDFIINGLIRMVYVDKTKPLFAPELKKEIDACLLDFKYWWDDTRRDTTYRCYHTENHQALYHTAELLAGQLYKDRKFTSGMTGKEHVEHARERLERWMDFRFRFGFSEWLSMYYDAEVMLLSNLYDYAEDEKIRTRAGMLLDMLMFDMALNNINGMLGATNGRAYVSSLIYGHHQMAPLMKLVFGVGVFLDEYAMGLVTLALSDYRCPDVIVDIATDYSKPMLNKQRSSIEVEDAVKYGLSYDNELDTHLFWGMQEFIHPLSIHMSKQISERYGVWPYNRSSYERFIERYEEEKEQHGKILNTRTDIFALSEANYQTYRTPDYLISSVQDYRKGAAGYQQHIWQATFDNNALVFTNYPGSKNLRNSPNYWAGNPSMPRAAQHENVLICIYNARGNNDFTHAYFPKAAFDEIKEVSGWVFARKGDGYLALYSRNPIRWAENDGVVNELIADGKQNIWICEMGSKKQWKSFDRFVKAVSGASIITDNFRVWYESPSKGKMEFGWDDPFVVKGKEMPLRYEYQYNNPYCVKAFNGYTMEIKKGKQSLTLDFEKLKREIKK